MLASLTQLLNHYAHRISITMQPHPLGAQMTISVLPCPNKVKDETLRQQLISPIVVAGNNESLLSQLKQLEDALGTVKENPVVEQSVSDYLHALDQATDKKPDTAKSTKAPAKAKEPKAPQADAPIQSEAQSPLDSMFM